MSDDIDPLAVEVTQEISEDGEKQVAATWEHEQLAQVRIKVFRGHEDSVNSGRFINNDRQILTASDDRTVKIWDFETGKLLQTFANGHSDIVSEASINDDSQKFATSSWDKTVKVWDLETGTVLWTGTHGGMVTCCRYSHDGKLVISGSDMDHTLKVWDSSSGELLNTINDLHTSTITSCMFTPNDDKIITTSMDRTSKFFDMKTCKVTIKLGGHINVISNCDISFDERKFVTASWDKTIQVWDIATGGYRSKGPTPLQGAHEGCVSSCHISKDGLMLVSGSYDQTIVVWDIDDEVQKLKLQGHTDWVQDVQFSLDQNWLLSSSRDTTIRLWNIEDTDKIPVVMEKRKAIGLKIIKCDKCGKPFSMSQLENFTDVTVCVFCRLQRPERSMMSVTETDR